LKRLEPSPQFQETVEEGLEAGIPNFITKLKLSYDEFGVHLEEEVTSAKGKSSLYSRDGGLILCLIVGSPAQTLRDRVHF
jgi:hypothetical protein